MAGTLPYVNQPGSIVKVLEKVREAKTPDRFTIDFLETKLGLKGGNYRQFLPLGKKLGLLNSDGTPTELYKRYRNSSTSKVAMAEAIRIGYHEAFDRNENAYSVSREQFKGLVVEITGSEQNNRVVQLTCQTFDALKKLADFDVEAPVDGGSEAAEHQEDRPPAGEASRARDDLGLNLAYTINLVLPKTDDPAVFNAIFRSLRENLLRG
jgi:hypothetical protein